MWGGVDGGKGGVERVRFKKFNTDGRKKGYIFFALILLNVLEVRFKKLNIDERSSIPQGFTPNRRSTGL